MLGQMVRVAGDGKLAALGVLKVFGEARLLNGRLAVAVGDPSLTEPSLDELQWVDLAEVVREHGDGSTYGEAPPAGG